MHAVKGFTALELIISVTILAILAAIAVPSLISTIQNNYSISLTNDMIKTLAYARSESMRGGQSLSICPLSSSGNGCGSDWSKGWIVYNGTTTYDNNSMTLLRNFTPSGTNANISTSPSVSIITYDRFGFITSTLTTFTIYATGCTIDNSRTITLSLTGYLDIANANCP